MDQTHISFYTSVYPERPDPFPASGIALPVFTPFQSLERNALA